MNSNWPRWIFASLSTYFVTALNTANIKMFVEGADRDGLDDLQSYVEFRLDGPDIKQITSTQFNIQVLLNILVTVKRDPKDIHLIHRILGQIIELCTSGISIYKLGTDIDDDQSYLGCMQIQTKSGRVVTVSHFGEVGVSVKLSLASVEATYVMRLSTS